MSGVLSALRVCGFVVLSSVLAVSATAGRTEDAVRQFWNLAQSTEAAQADNVDVVGVARSVSLILSIKERCGDFYLVNQQYAENFVKAMLGWGIAVFGERAVEQALDEEMPRRNREIAATGVQAWCVYQKASQERLGNTALFQVETPE
jgi:hypothetical protein